MALIKGVFALFVFTLLSVTARAGDQAIVNVLGFSADGTTFVFEEYGIQDGSGFAYANRFYIDTRTDSFLAGTPIRARIENEMSNTAQARAAARQQALVAGLISDDALLPAFAAGLNTPTQASSDPAFMIVNPRPVVPPIDIKLGVSLETFGVVASSVCENMGVAIQGFRLTKLATAAGQSARLLHEDASVPASRSCPLDYGLAGIFTFYPDNNPAVFATLIYIETLGFEGPDFRYLAVTAPIDP